MSDYRQKMTDMMREWATRELLEEVERFIDLDAPGYEDAECAMTVLYERSDPDDREGLVEALDVLADYVTQRGGAFIDEDTLYDEVEGKVTYDEACDALRALRDRLADQEAGDGDDK